MKVALWIVAAVCLVWVVMNLAFPYKASPESRWRGAVEETWDILGRYHSPDMGWADTNTMVPIKLGTLIEVHRRAEEPDMSQNAAHLFQRASVAFAFVGAVSVFLLGRQWKREKVKSS